MSPLIHKAKYILLGIVFIAFVWVGAFGILSAAQMSHGERQVGCTVTLGEHVICAMSPFEYLSVWQQVFTAPPTLFASVLLLVIVLGVALYVCVKRDIFDPLKLTNYLKIPRRFTFYIPNLYTELFSQGILHPKAP